MRKVTTINLNGQAYQLEEPAYDKLHAYLKRAEKTLAGDPDKVEVIADIEQAIADKCDRMLEPGKNVVTDEQINGILEQMGEVESEDEAAAAEPKAGHEGAKQPGNSKRLFVIRDGAMLLGVCQGIAAYLGVDVTLVRIAFVVLTFLTNGFWILLYAILAIILPVAKSDAELAEAHGKPMTAQDIVERARERAPTQESLRRFSDATVKIFRMVAKLSAIVLYAVFGIFTAMWAFVQSQLMFGNLQFHDQLAVLNGWRQWLAFAAVYAIFAIPIFGTARLLDRCSEERKSRPANRAAAIGDTALGLLWGLAVVIVISLGSSYGRNFEEYVNQHNGYIDIGDSSICVDDTQCTAGERLYRPDSKLN